LTPRRRLELGDGDHLAIEMLSNETPVVNERLGFSLQSIQLSHSKQ